MGVYDYEYYVNILRLEEVVTLTSTSSGIINFRHEPPFKYRIAVNKLFGVM